LAVRLFAVGPVGALVCRRWADGGVAYRETDGFLCALDILAVDCLALLQSCAEPLSAAALRERLRTSRFAVPDERGGELTPEYDLPDAAWFEDCLNQLTEQGLVQVTQA